MKVRVAKSAGFCWGVKRAVDRVIQISDSTGSEVYTLGPLIHNPQTIEHLESKNVHVVEEPAQAVGGTLVFRAHGITPQVRQNVQSMERTYSDATCPDVGIIASAVKKHYRRGYFIVIYGKKGHAETIGLEGYAPDRSAVVRTPEDVAELPDADKVCLVSQSTMNDAEFEEIADAVRRRYADASSVEVHNTICEDTRNRQTEVLTLAREVDAMVVVGGRNSSNTNHLAELSRGTGTATWHVETEDELDPAEFSGCRVVGVTAGASTPHWRIERVRDTLAAMEGAPEGPVARLRGVAAFLVRSNLYLAAGAVGLTALCMAVQGLLLTWPAAWAALLASGLFVFAAHTHNQQNHRKALAVSDPARHALLTRRPALTWALVLAAGIGSLALGAALDLWAFLMLLGPLAGAAVYRWKVLPAGEGRKSVSHLSGSKDLVTAGAWATVAGLMPAAGARGLEGLLSPGPWACYVVVFGLIAIRSILYDLRDLEGDRMVGRETLPMVLGHERTKLLATGILAAAAGWAVLAALTGVLGVPALWMLVPLAWTGLGLWAYHRRIVHKGLRFEVLVDGALFVAGAAALATLAL